MNKAKALKTADKWLFPALMYAVYDCCDSMHEAERLEDRFNAYVDDKVSIQEYVKKNLRLEFLAQCVNVLKEGGYDRNEWREQFESTPSELPIPFAEVEADLEKLFS